MKKTIVVVEVSTWISYAIKPLGQSELMAIFSSIVGLVPNLAKTVSVPICILIFLFLHIVQHRYSYIEPGLPVIKK